VGESRRRSDLGWYDGGAAYTFADAPAADAVVGAQRGGAGEGVSSGAAAVEHRRHVGLHGAFKLADAGLFDGSRRRRTTVRRFAIAIPR
jgi:hypothetical protein